MLRLPALCLAVAAVLVCPAGVKSAPSPSPAAESLRLAIQDLSETFASRYPQGQEFLARLAAWEKQAAAAAPADAAAAKARADELAAQLEELRREALLANPLLDFKGLLLVKRHAKQIGMPHNWQSNSSIAKTGYDNEIALLSLVRPGGKLTTLYRPEGKQFVGDIRLHFDARRLLLSMPGKNGRWHVHEINVDGTGLRQVTPDLDGVDQYDACYLSDGAIIFGSTACMQGVPCVAGGDHVSNLYRLEADGKTVRQLCFEQDHDWHPTLLNNGRVLYARWEYADVPHCFNRLLFHMNADGSEQMEYYGSNSYWPNSVFYPRAVPGHPTKIVGIVSGHHGAARCGEMVIFDPARGRHEADGAIQRIGSRGRAVEPLIIDALTDASWPKFLHPWPLSEKYFLAACRPTKSHGWGIYLVDVFDNLLCLIEQPPYAMLEPVPLQATPRPPEIQPKVDLARRDALVYLSDVYGGAGLAGVPRGAVKRLRLFTYHYAYQGVGGQQMRVGLDGPWDVRRILGTVPVETDGSAYFRVPANTPISVQPLDDNGQALQLMRSWMTPMPGEVLSCAGCHEPQNTAPPNRATLATRRAPSEIEPWRGPVRNFSFVREVQPVLDKYCVRCHDGSTGSPPGGSTGSPPGGKARDDGRIIPDLTNRPPVNVNPVRGLHGIGNFPPAYYELRRRVRGHTAEGDLHVLTPGEFRADTTHLVRMLRKGHHDVKLDAEAWDRLITWIDLNTPCHGSWAEVVGDRRVDAQRQARQKLRERYACVAEDPEAERQDELPQRSKSAPPYQPPQPPAEASALVPPTLPTTRPAVETHTIDLGDGVRLELVKVPAGEFTMGDETGLADEKPPARVRIGQPFWMGRCEITNRQYRLFDPRHDSRLERSGFLHFNPTQRGQSMDGDDQPALRVSWTEAMAFCRWLSRRTGRRFTLPDEAQWEYACRASTGTPLWFGPVRADFARLANLADGSLNALFKEKWAFPHNVIPPWHLAANAVDDHYRPTAPVGTYQPNPWGLCDMHGNAAEWTRSAYRPYPWRGDDGRNPPADADPSALSPLERRVVRGGSFYDPPRLARSACRRDHAAWQQVFDVGFRVVCLPE
ncbi:MAG: Formylglycine-generating sulfatase enzyme [Planctomycetes bacterium ADurb.Bin126]|nr:MAG: Formylglycine-generating sulfatase enzyme [Planctomycetes bacterium ADurb.Bin126]